VKGLSSTSRLDRRQTEDPKERRPKAPVLALLAAAFAFGAVSGCTTSTNGTGPELPIDGSTVDAIQPDGAAPDARPPADATTDTGASDVASPPGDATTEGGDASQDAGGPDSPLDSAPPPCDGLVCNGACLHANDCSACTGATLLCGPTNTCVQQCGSCRDTADAGLPIECFACDSAHAHPIGTCESADSAYCLGGDYFSGPAGTGYHCGCPTGNASDCPGMEQVCFNVNGQNLCATCGEPIPLSASGGTSCKAQGTSCVSASHTCQ
jgi:hypothetical protein